MATREVQMLQQMLDPGEDEPTGENIDEINEIDVPNAAGDQSVTREQELTSEMKENMPVVNRARKQNRLSGISNFLNNPEVQNALLQFGRAFTGGREGEPGTILANAGEKMIQGQANQRAMEAFERGEDPAQAAGRFADPELISRLQQQQQQSEQFDQKMELREEQADLSRAQLQTDTAYKFAKLAQSEELTRKQIQLKQDQLEIDRDVAEARTGLLEAEMKAVGTGQVDAARLSEASTAYLDTLERQRTNYLEQLQTIEDVETEVQDIFSGGLKVNINTNEAWVRKRARELGVSVTDEEGNLSMDEIVEKLENQKSIIQEKINQNQEQEEIIRKGQAQRLGGSQGGGGTDQDDEGGGDDTPEPQGSPDSPVKGDFTMSDLRDMPSGSYATSSLTGETYFIGSDGEPRIYNPNEDEEE